MAGKKNYEAKAGIYTLSHPNKYNGKITNGGVSFRSSWEERLYYYMDNNKNVIEWSAETLIVPYIFSIDGKVHRYYPDIVCKVASKDGSQKKYMIEVKPEKQTIEPTKPLNRGLERKRRYESDMFVYVKNQDKWKAATDYCRKNRMEFKILTENDIFGRSH
jgi:hypothetical protein